MKTELELEAEKYAQEWGWETRTDFIAGATSKYVEKQKLEFAIEQLKSHIEHPTKPGYRRHDILNKIAELEQKIKKL